MASQLAWRLGFGWIPIFWVAAGGYVCVTATGGIRWVGAVMALAAVAYMVEKYNAWNGAGWRKVHSRAMLLYARLWGEEVSRAEAHGEAPSRQTACRVLWDMLDRVEGIRMGGATVALAEAGNMPALFAEMAAVDQRRGPRAFPAMHFHELADHGPERMAEVLGHHRALWPAHWSPAHISECQAALRSWGIDPRLVVWGIVDRYMGESEGVRYIVVLFTGNAR